MEIGEKIRKIRTLKGFSQEYIAEQLKISQVAYSDIENNKTKLSLQRLENLSEIFDVSITDILAFDEKHIFNNTFNNSSKGSYNVQKVINENFNNERIAYMEEIKFLREQILYLRSKLDK